MSQNSISITSNAIISSFFSFFRRIFFENTISINNADQARPIYATHRNQRSLSNTNLLQSISENENLIEQTRELAILEERNRLARELHDCTKQKAFAALTHLGTAKYLSKENVVLNSHIKQAEDLILEVVEELSSLINEMYSKQILENGLTNALQDLVIEWEAHNLIKVGFQVSGTQAVPLEVSHCFFRITQEALANIARHSNASIVTLELVFGNTFDRLVITDNGNGFLPGNNPQGIGLKSINDRVRQLNGSLKIISQPGQGTCLEVRIPKNGYLCGAKNEKTNLCFDC